MAVFSRAELDELYLPERLSPLVVAEKIRLSPDSNVLSEIDLELTPYLKLPISLIGVNRFEWIFILAPTQSGKTVFLQTAIADTIDQDPGTLIYVLPDQVLAKKSVKEKLISMIKWTPDLAKHATDRFSLSMTQVTLDHMTIYPAWGGSLATLSSIPAKRVILDEVRLMPLEIGNESNAIKLAADRLTTYKAMSLAQGYAVSTPSIEGDLLHQQLSVSGTTVLRWNVVCQNCGKVQVLDFFTNMFYKDNKAYCKCKACGHLFDDSDKKRKMNSTGFYTISGSSEPVNFDNLKGNRIFFWYDSLVSPFRSFDAIYTEFFQSKDKVHDYKNFIQCWLARFWVNDVSKTSVANLKTCFIEEPMGLVPDWTKVITAGVDTQDEGFYLVVRAFGSARRSRVLKVMYIPCSMHIADFEMIYEKLSYEIEQAVFSDKNGRKWKIAMWAIDTGGHRTKQVYAACDLMDRVIKVKGSSPKQMTTIKYNSEINLYLVKTNEYLEETEELANIGGGLFELPATVGDDFMNQWCNKRKVKEKNKKTGVETVIWKNIGQNDYRMADIHSFICLDIPTDIGTFRSEIEKDGFQYNPHEVFVKASEVVSKQEIEQYYEEEDTSYDVGSFSEGW